MNFKILFWDLDGTIIDTHKSVENSLLYCFKKLNIEDKYNLDLVNDYYQINSNYWKNLGSKYHSIDEILKLRFEEFFNKYNINRNAKLASDYYEEEASRTVYPFDNIKNILLDLKKSFKMYITTNGKTYVQRNKLLNAGITDFFNDIFISEVIGFNKPDIRYFKKILDSIGEYKKDEILMIGDSIDSDIKGANNIGIKCCLYNPKKIKYNTDLKIDFEITNHNELYNILLK